jgi:antitoxin MazE
MVRIAIAKWGNSLAIRLPSHLARDLELSSGSELELRVEEGRLIASPRPTRIPLSELVKGIKPSNRHGETDWGEPVGNEVW